MLRAQIWLEILWLIKTFWVHQGTNVILSQLQTLNCDVIISLSESLSWYYQGKVSLKFLTAVNLCRHRTRKGLIGIFSAHKVKTGLGI